MKFTEVTDLEGIAEGCEVIDSEGAVFGRTANGWQDYMDRAWEKAPTLPAYVIEYEPGDAGWED